MTSSFRPHGTFNTRIEGRLIVSEVTGPWNMELVQHWGKSCLPVATELAATGPWIGIAVIRESMLCPPEALAALRRIVAHSATQLHCAAHVIVAGPEVDGRDFLEPIFARVYEGLVEHAIFYTFDEARAWSLALLAGR